MPSSIPEERDIKAMKLYSDVERIDNELRAMGIDEHAELDATQLSSIDSMHYEGNSAVRAAIDCIGVNSSKKMLDIGSGFGGPARLLALETQCSVVALELQADIHEKATELTNRCNLGEFVTHRHGNILDGSILEDLGGGVGSFDGVVSWLAFLHISDKKLLLSTCAKMLTSGGSIFADDFYMRSPFTDVEKDSLKDDVFCSDLPTKADYIAILKESGFEKIRWEDKTADWTIYVNDRLNDFLSNRENFERIHGTPTFERLRGFYKAVVALFNGGHLGGVRFHATKSGA